MAILAFCRQSIHLYPIFEYVLIWCNPLWAQKKNKLRKRADSNQCIYLFLSNNTNKYNLWNIKFWKINIYIRLVRKKMKQNWLTYNCMHLFNPFTLKKAMWKPMRKNCIDSFAYKCIIFALNWNISQLFLFRSENIYFHIWTRGVRIFNKKTTTAYTQVQNCSPFSRH